MAEVDTCVSAWGKSCSNSSSRITLEPNLDQILPISSPIAPEPIMMIWLGICLRLRGSFEVMMDFWSVGEKSNSAGLDPVAKTILSAVIKFKDPSFPALAIISVFEVLKVS